MTSCQTKDLSQRSPENYHYVSVENKNAVSMIIKKLKTNYYDFVVYVLNNLFSLFRYYLKPYKYVHAFLLPGIVYSNCFAIHSITDIEVAICTLDHIWSYFSSLSFVKTFM